MTSNIIDLTPYIENNKARLEEEKTMLKIKAENFNAGMSFDAIMGHPMEALEALTVKPYALNKTKDTE